MARSKKSESVPKAMQAKFDSIVALTDEFSKQVLNDEYAELIRLAAAALARKRPSPLAKGQSRSWACGIAHAIGMVNFLFDPSQTPHIKATELYDWFGVSSSTGQGKSKTVRDTLDMHQLDPNWCLSSLLDENPLAWMVSVGDFIVDIRTAPPEVQQAAYEKGLIPYLPEAAKRDLASTSKRDTTNVPLRDNALYTMEVCLISGLMKKEFVERNPSIIRTIEIAGRQTLKDLHDIIFKAYDRHDSHLYEFQIGGEGPNDPAAERYVPSDIKDVPMPGSKPTGIASETTIDSLKLSVGEYFGYWFDFGDDWWHSVEVLAIADEAPKGKYPKITKRVGDSPPQYLDE